MTQHHLTEWITMATQGSAHGDQEKKETQRSRPKGKYDREKDGREVAWGGEGFKEYWENGERQNEGQKSLRIIKRQKRKMQSHLFRIIDECWDINTGIQPFYFFAFLHFLFMRKKCNAIGQERIAIRETAPTWRKGAVTCRILKTVKQI